MCKAPLQLRIVQAHRTLRQHPVLTNTNGITSIILIVFAQAVLFLKCSYDRFGESSQTQQTPTPTNILPSNATTASAPINLGTVTSNQQLEGDSPYHHQSAAHSFNSACLGSGAPIPSYGHLPANGYASQAHQTSAMLFANTGVGAAQTMPTQLMGLSGYPPYAWISRSYCKVLKYGNVASCLLVKGSAALLRRDSAVFKFGDSRYKYTYLGVHFEIL
ncbi:hypothetical protein Tsp_06372 [Trichinella spiralis]|uniref:hypothetical protein n=1 Tax=Trichinella spiralis TaxID=6334 RepID=UPI0001EFC0D3|nr:hypothetical protein Tsp_06372 [Trichinella spiralis]